MKKLLLILGAIFLIGVVLVVAIIGFVAYNGTRLDASSKQYVDFVVPDITSTWSKAKLLNQASAELKQVATEDQIDPLFKKLSELGKLNEYQGSKGDSFMSYTTQNGKQITAKYVANALFENGTAEFNIQLIQHDEHWQILSFHVNSPIFLK